MKHSLAVSLIVSLGDKIRFVARKVDGACTAVKFEPAK